MSYGVQIFTYVACCTPENYIVLLTNVTSINLISLKYFYNYNLVYFSSSSLEILPIFPNFP